MEENNLPPQPAVPIVNTPPVPVPAPEGSSNKLVLWFIIGLVLVIGLVGGIYFYLSKQAAKPEAPVSQKPIVQVQPSPPDTMDALERDLNDIKDASPDSDFTSVDQDLGQL